MENGKAQVVKQTGLDIFDFVNLTASLNKATAQIATLMQEKIALEAEIEAMRTPGTPPLHPQQPSA